MPISLACDCGTNLKVKDELVGRKVRCPKCSGVVSVPERPREEEILDVIPVPDQPKEVNYGLKPEPVPAASPFENLEEPPSFRRTDMIRSRRAPSNEGWFGSVNGGVMGGFAMIMIAVVWFFLGLLGNRIFFYPPVLFVIGIIAVIKGLAGGE